MKTNKSNEYVKAIEKETFKRVKAHSSAGEYDLLKVLEMMNR